MEETFVGEELTAEMTQNEEILMADYLKGLRESDISVNDDDFGVWEPSIFKHKDPFDPTAQYTEIGSKGNIVVIGGLPKTMKTTVRQAIVASAYSDSPSRTLGFNLKVPKGQIIMDIDTEQSKKWCDLYYRNLATITGHYQGPKENNMDIPNYKIKKMRNLNPSERVDKIDRIVKTFKHDIAVMFIDGIADLIYDENNRTESKDIVSKCMQWTDDYDILLVTNIHLTESAQKTKLNGVLGTELQKKMDAAIICHMHDESDKKRPIVRLESWRTRGPGIDDTLFRRERGLPHLMQPE